MKIRLMIGILCLVVFGVAGFPITQDWLRSTQELQNATAEMTSYNEKLQNSKEQSDELLLQLQTEGKDVCLNNDSTAQMFHSLNGSTISNITAMGTVDGILGEIISTDNVDDVSFFGPTVSAIKYDFIIDDADTFLASLKQTVFLSNELSIDLDNSAASIIVPSSSGLYQPAEHNEEIDEEVTEE